MATGTHIDLGHALITMVEPTEDHDALVEYNRWYDHDHAYSGVMAGPWAFAFGRWVATRDLKSLRLPEASPIADPLGLGSFIAAYFLLDQRASEHFEWSFSQTPWLHEQGRMNGDREHVSTSLYDFTGAVNRDGWPVPAEIALDHRYGGLVATWIDREPSSTFDDLDRWARTALLPELSGPGSPVAQSLCFAPRDFPGIDGSGVGVGERLCVLSFLHDDPREAWQQTFADIDEHIASGGAGRLALAAPFIPVVPGTETYLDELW